MKRCVLALGLLMSTVEFDRTHVARAQTADVPVAESRPDVHPGTITTASVWARAGEAELQLLNPSPRAARAEIAWKIRALNTSRRTVWTQRQTVSAVPGATPARIRSDVALPFGPYEISATIGEETSSAYFVVAPRVTPRNDTTILATDRAREAATRWANLGVRVATTPDVSAPANLETVSFVSSAALARAASNAKTSRFIDAQSARLAPAGWPQTTKLPLAVRWPEDGASCAAQTDASAFRALVANRRWFGKAQPFAVVLPSRMCAEAQTATRIATAWAAGASRVFVQSQNAADALSPEEAKRMAALAGFETVRDGARFEGELFPASPLLHGVSFAGKRTRVALIWLERNADLRARLIVPLRAQMFDVWGNEIGRDRNGSLVVPLNAPVWVRANSSNWSRAWAKARLENTRLLAAQVLPFARRTNIREIAIRMQNTGIAPLAGTVSVAPPAGWKMAQSAMNYRLASGEAQVFRFAVAASKARKDDLYSVGVAASRGTSTQASRWTWQQSARVASAEEAASPPDIDGDLGEWKDAAWMPVRNEQADARVALRWDLTHLYVAAEVREKEFAGAMREDFWNGNAIQLAFGLRTDAASRPQRGPFRDTDYGFLLVPWKNDDGTTGGRVLRAWNAEIPFDGWNASVLDRRRWGGAAAQSACVVRRDAARGITRYEARFSSREMPTLRPPRRAAENIAARFSFQVHSPAANSNSDLATPALSWSRANNVFAWWGNAVSFQNGGAISLAAQVPIGFAALPPRELLPALPPAAAPIAPRVLIREALPPIEPEARRAPETGSPQARRATQRRSRRPRAPKYPPREIAFETPELQPMSPRTLPPAASPSGTRIPPAPVR